MIAIFILKNGGLLEPKCDTAACYHILQQETDAATRRREIAGRKAQSPFREAPFHEAI